MYLAGHMRSAGSVFGNPELELILMDADFKVCAFEERIKSSVEEAFMIYCTNNRNQIIKWLILNE